MKPCGWVSFSLMLMAHGYLVVNQQRQSSREHPILFCSVVVQCKIKCTFTTMCYLFTFATMPRYELAAANFAENSIGDEVPFVFLIHCY